MAERMPNTSAAITLPGVIMERTSRSAKYWGDSIEP